MTDRTVTHATFALERMYAHPPAKVFRAFADPAIKARWFAAPDDWGRPETAMDFREGGREFNRAGPKGGPMHAFEARYWDIVPNERIVFTYDMLIDETRISVSLVSVELHGNGDGTRLTFTEHGAYLDGHDTVAAREHGTGELLDALGGELDRQSAAAANPDRKE